MGEKIDGLDIAKAEIRKYLERLKAIPIEWAVNRPYFGITVEEFSWEMDRTILEMLRQAVNEMIVEMHESRTLAEWYRHTQEGGE
ncbi:MAG: hypothetical protein WAP52_01130 [Candidatus Sungiibacteriota bacterium]